MSVKPASLEDHTSLVWVKPGGTFPPSRRHAIALSHSLAETQFNRLRRQRAADRHGRIPDFDAMNPEPAQRSGDLGIFAVRNRAVVDDRQPRAGRAGDGLELKCG